MSLTNTYRPSDYKQVIGNAATVAALQDHVEKKKNPNRCLLFVGPSGTGKTTLARLVVRKLTGRENPQGYHELNASDFRGIDTVREVGYNAKFAPVLGEQWRIFFFDECHKLTADAQEAILKLMESPPAHVWLLFATTEPTKLKPTFKRRCVEFALSQIGNRELKELLLSVAEKEGIEVSPARIGRIINSSEGSPGIALKLLDSVTADGGGDEGDLSYKFIKELTKTDWRIKGELLLKMRTANYDPETVRRQVLRYYSTVLINNGDMRAYDVLDCFSKPFYDTGFPGLVKAAFEVHKRL